MVSDAQLNAKIDSQSGHVILGLEPPDVYQQVLTLHRNLRALNTGLRAFC